jgi:hypothetical protein
MRRFVAPDDAICRLGYASLAMLESPEIRRRKPHRCRPTADAAIEAIRAAKGMLGVAAEHLGVGRTSLQTMARNNSRIGRVLWEERQKVGDLAEARLFKLISEGDYRAITFYLTTMCRDRGYSLPKGTSLNTGDVSNVMIGSVVIRAVESGKYLAEPPDVTIEGPSATVVPLRVIEGDGRSALGGRTTDVEPETKLN